MMVGWFRNLPVTLRVPVVTATLMILLGLVASQGVLTALRGVQDSRLVETARLHVEGLSVASGPFVLRQDVWEVYDILERARAASDGQRLLQTVVADARGQVLAASDPTGAPVGSEISAYEADAVAPIEVTMTGAPTLRVMAPLRYQGRDEGRIVTELDVTDLLAERRRVSLWLLFGNAAATAVLTFAGWFAVARILRPVGALVRTMDATEGVPRQIADADIPRGDPGLARLIATYNRMTAAGEARAEAERRLAERERSVSLGRLSSSLAHEINNPLGGLLNAADTIVNLLLNASEAAGQGGQVGLSVSNGADVLSILVKDTGPGLSPDHLTRLFYSCPLPPGGGVGLRLAHDIVVGLNGRISHSRGEGTTVIRVDLPIAAVRHD